MVERLKLISKTIHWSLLFKSLAVAGAWILLPEWIAWVLGAVFYFSSLFRARHMGLPLLASFLLAHFFGSEVWVGIFLGALFFLILGIKELVFIDRRMASTLMISGIIFGAGFLLYNNADAWGPTMAIKAFVFAWLFWALARGFILEAEERHPKYGLALLTMSFLLWEIAMVVGFLPIDYLYQGAILVLISFTFFEWLLAYLWEKLNKNKILLYLSFLLILATLIFSSVNWSL